MKRGKTLTMIILGMVLILMPIINAGIPANQTECGSRLTPGKTCVVTTPHISCNRYTIYNVASGAEVVSDTMTLLNSTIYWFMFNQTTRGSYLISLCDNSTSARILVEGEDEMASLSIVIFIMAITSVFFILPFKVEKFAESNILNIILKRSCWLMGLFLLALNSAIVATIADNAGIEVTKEIFRYMWLINKGAYIFMVFIIWRMLVDTLKLYKWEKQQKRMGRDEEPRGIL